MLLTLEGNTEHVAHLGLFCEKKKKYVTALDINKCLTQIK